MKQEKSSELRMARARIAKLEAQALDLERRLLAMARGIVHNAGAGFDCEGGWDTNDEDYPCAYCTAQAMTADD